MSFGVANVSRSEYGTTYYITRDRDGIRYGKVEESLTGVCGVRDDDDEPAQVGSVFYDRMIAAVKSYKAWAEQH